MAIVMDGHAVTELDLLASDGSQVTKQLAEVGTIPTPTETLDVRVNGLIDVTNYKKVNVQVEGGGELPTLTNPASASDIVKDKEAIDGSGNKIIGTNTFDADTSDADAVAADIAEGKTAYVNGAKVTGTASGGGESITPWAVKRGSTVLNSDTNEVVIDTGIATLNSNNLQFFQAIRSDWETVEPSTLDRPLAFLYAVYQMAVPFGTNNMRALNTLTADGAYEYYQSGVAVSVSNGVITCDYHSKSAAIENFLSGTTLNWVVMYYEGDANE